MERRKDMTPSELVALGLRIEELERPKAAARKAGTEDAGEAATRTADAVGRALGISGSNYYRARTLVQAAKNGDEKAQEEVRRMDQTGSITPAYNRWKGRKSAAGGHKEPAHRMETVDDEGGQRRPPRRQQWDLIRSGISALKGMSAGFVTVKNLDADITRDEATQLERELAESLRTLRGFHKKVREFLDASK